MLESLKNTRRKADVDGLIGRTEMMLVKGWSQWKGGLQEDKRGSVIRRMHRTGLDGDG